MMLAYDIVLCSETREDVEIQLDRECTALEGREMKISRTKTEYLALKGDQSHIIELRGVKVLKVRDFK